MVKGQALRTVILRAVAPTVIARVAKTAENFIELGVDLIFLFVLPGTYTTLRSRM